ncbi:hypothetical protein BJ742DRAFT_482016 [Cladochytrium replicatum]|nr:hypothetical protein BJ742DRAFT_482016 [Cladochytrium replicatum]
MMGIEAGDDNVLTMSEYIENEAKLLQDAAEALPGAIDKCSFPHGYVRQRVYSCIDCTVDPLRPSGVCYACFVSCHTTCKNVEELFCRRSFRCDCGTDRLKSPCSIMKKDAGCCNENKYSKNFAGQYCWCDRRYDHTSEEGTMYQCLICEDWKHDRCIGKVPDESSFDEYICRDCVSLHGLRRFRSNGGFEFIKAAENAKVEPNPRKRKLEDRPENGESSKKPYYLALGQPSGNFGDHGDREEQQQLVEIEGDGKNDEEKCTLKQQEKVDADMGFYDLFCAGLWRDSICRCSKCMNQLAGIEFILSEEEEFEPDADEDADQSLLDIGMKQLNRMDRIQANEGAIAFRKLRDKLDEYLRTFAENGKVVSKEDIAIFFEKIRQEDRR